MLASRDGKIVFENTLDARLDVIFHGKLPEVLKLGLSLHPSIFVNLAVICWYVDRFYTSNTLKSYM